VPFLKTLAEQHQAGVSEHSAIIWSLMMFESFLRKVHDRPAQAPAAQSQRRAALAG